MRGRKEGRVYLVFEILLVLYRPLLSGRFMWTTRLVGPPPPPVPPPALLTPPPPLVPPFPDDEEDDDDEEEDNSDEEEVACIVRQFVRRADAHRRNFCRRLCARASSIMRRAAK